MEKETQNRIYDTNHLLNVCDKSLSFQAYLIQIF